MEEMNLTAKAAYIKGLMDGMNMDTGSNQGKVLAAMQSLLADMAENIEVLNADVEQVYDELDSIDEDMDDLEAVLYGDEDDEYDDDEPDDEDDEVDLDYEVTCPKCGATVVMSEDTLLQGDVSCPQCGADFDITLVDEETPGEE